MPAGALSHPPATKALPPPVCAAPAPARQGGLSSTQACSAQVLPGSPGLAAGTPPQQQEGLPACRRHATITGALFAFNRAPPGQGLDPAVIPGVTIVIEDAPWAHQAQSEQRQQQQHGAGGNASPNSVAAAASSGLAAAAAAADAAARPPQLQLQMQPASTQLAVYDRSGRLLAAAAQHPEVPRELPRDPACGGLHIWDSGSAWWLLFPDHTHAQGFRTLLLMWRMLQRAAVLGYQPRRSFCGVVLEPAAGPTSSVPQPTSPPQRLTGVAGAVAALAAQQLQQQQQQQRQRDSPASSADAARVAAEPLPSTHFSCVASTSCLAHAAERAAGTGTGMGVGGSTSGSDSGPHAPTTNPAVLLRSMASAAPATGAAGRPAPPPIQQQQYQQQQQQPMAPPHAPAPEQQRPWMAQATLQQWLHEQQQRWQQQQQERERGCRQEAGQGQGQGPPQWTNQQQQEAVQAALRAAMAERREAAAARSGSPYFEDVYFGELPPPPGVPPQVLRYQMQLPPLRRQQGPQPWGKPAPPPPAAQPAEAGAGAAGAQAAAGGP